MLFCALFAGGGCRTFFFRVAEVPAYAAESRSWYELLHWEDFMDHDYFAGELEGVEVESDSF